MLAGQIPNNVGFSTLDGIIDRELIKLKNLILTPLSLHREHNRIVNQRIATYLAKRNRK